VSDKKLLAIIPARGGSKGLPGKNIRPFAGLPLLAHSILFAKMCPEIDRFIVSTDSPEIAAVAREFEAEVPFLRPNSLAEDSTPMFPVVRHALDSIESSDGQEYGFVLLLDPTSPARHPEDVTNALDQLTHNASAEGVVTVSKPDFNPIWNCVVERKGWMAPLIDEGDRFGRRQEVPTVYRINGALYIWRSAFVRRVIDSWRQEGKHLKHMIPEVRAMSIDTLEEFTRAEVLVRSGLVRFPWLSEVH